MAKLFIRPSQVVTRLEETRALLTAKNPTLPAFKIMEVEDGQVQDELADSDAAAPEETVLYVANGLSTGSLITDAGFGPTEIDHGITVGIAIGTRDEHAQYAIEWATLLKEFLVLSLHGWEWQAGYTPLRFTTESLFRVKGRAIYFRTYDFSHTSTLEFSDVDDAFDLFDQLDDFLELYGDIEGKLLPSSDTVEIAARLDIPPP